MFDCMHNPKFSVHNSISRKIFVHLCFIYFYFIFDFCPIMQCLLEITCVIDG